MRGTRFFPVVCLVAFIAFIVASNLSYLKLKLLALTSSSPVPDFLSELDDESPEPSATIGSLAPSRAAVIPPSQIPLLDSRKDPSSTKIFLRNEKDFDHLTGVVFGNRKIGTMGVCSVLLKDRSVEDYRMHSTFVNVSFGCLDLFKSTSILAAGTGNRIATLYAVRTAAEALGQTDLVLHCHDAIEQRRELVLPWMMGVFPRLDDGNSSNTRSDGQRTSVNKACKSPLEYQSEQMIFEFRRFGYSNGRNPIGKSPCCLLG